MNCDCIRRSTQASSSEKTLKETSTAVITFDGSLPVAWLNVLMVGIRRGEGEAGDKASSTESHGMAANHTHLYGGGSQDIDLLSLFKAQKGNQV